jgi:transposase InsO family protein
MWSRGLPESKSRLGFGSATPHKQVLHITRHLQLLRGRLDARSARIESAEFAKRLIGETLEKEGIEDGQELTVHCDRGPSMTSRTVGPLLADLSITRSLSRPYTSRLKGIYQLSDSLVGW